MRASLLLLLGGCVTEEPARRPEPTGVLEGVIRQREASCGSARFSDSLGAGPAFVGSSPVANRRFSLRAGGVNTGAEVFRVVTNDEGGFRANLSKGSYCFVDVTSAADGPCAAVLRYDPAVEPIPFVFVAPRPCPK